MVPRDPIRSDVRGVNDIDAGGQLERIANSDDFVTASSELVDTWASSGVGLDVVDPVLGFIERHPALDFGSPGPLVHFVERFYGRGYEDKLLESVARKPTPLTAWMLNRLINGAKSEPAKDSLLGAMRRIASDPMADAETRDAAQHFVSRATNPT